jgi:hypothetical protein
LAKSLSGQLRQSLSEHCFRLGPRVQFPLGCDQQPCILGLLPSLFGVAPRIHGLFRFPPRVTGTDCRARLLLALASAFVQGFLSLLSLGQRCDSPLFGTTQPHAALPQRVEMIALIHQRLLALLLPLRVQQSDPLRQPCAAVSRHLLQVGQPAKLLRPCHAADFLSQPTTDPAQALLLYHHQHRITNVDFIRRSITHLLPRILIQNLEQRPRLLAQRLGTPTQTCRTQRLARNQHIQQSVALRQRDTTTLADTSKFRLLFLSNDHRHIQAPLQFRNLLS